jgi:hypothetical protein
MLLRKTSNQSHKEGILKEDMFNMFNITPSDGDRHEGVHLFTISDMVYVLPY